LRLGVRRGRARTNGVGDRARKSHSATGEAAGAHEDLSPRFRPWRAQKKKKKKKKGKKKRVSGQLAARDDGSPAHRREPTTSPSAVPMTSDKRPATKSAARGLSDFSFLLFETRPAPRVTPKRRGGPANRAVSSRLRRRGRNPRGALMRGLGTAGNEGQPSKGKEEPT